MGIIIEQQIFILKNEKLKLAFILPFEYENDCFRDDLVSNICIDLLKEKRMA